MYPSENYRNNIYLIWGAENSSLSKQKDPGWFLPAKEVFERLTLKLESEIMTITEYLWSISNVRLESHAPRIQERCCGSSAIFPQVRTQGNWKEIQWIHYFMFETLRRGLNSWKGSEGLHQNLNFAMSALMRGKPGSREWIGNHGKKISSLETLRYQGRFLTDFKHGPWYHSRGASHSHFGACNQLIRNLWCHWKLVAAQKLRQPFGTRAVPWYNGWEPPHLPLH